MEDREYPVILKPLCDEDGGGYLAYVPDLPGCVSDGATEAEALANVQDALAAWMERAREMGHPIPPPSRADAASIKKNQRGPPE
jgi:antitoxin HicB